MFEHNRGSHRQIHKRETTHLSIFQQVQPISVFGIRAIRNSIFDCFDALFRVSVAQNVTKKEDFVVIFRVDAAAENGRKCVRNFSNNTTIRECENENISQSKHDATTNTSTR